MAACAALLVANVATLVSAHNGGADLIHSCVGGGGTIKIIEPNDSCGKNESALDWNKQGPAGPPGISGYELIVVIHPSDNQAQRAFSVDCPSGKRVLGGGYDLVGQLADVANITITQSRAVNQGQTWLVLAQAQGLPANGTTSFTWGASAHAVCATVAS